MFPGLARPSSCSECPSAFPKQSLKWAQRVDTACRRSLSSVPHPLEWGHLLRTLRPPGGVAAVPPGGVARPDSAPRAPTELVLRAALFSVLSSAFGPGSPDLKLRSWTKRVSRWVRRQEVRAGRVLISLCGVVALRR